MGLYWKCNKCGSRFREPDMDKNTTIYSCPNYKCKSNDIDVVSF